MRKTNMSKLLTAFTTFMFLTVNTSNLFANTPIQEDIPLKNGFFSIFTKSALKIDGASSNEIWSRARNRFQLSKPQSSDRYQRHIKRLAHHQGYVNSLINNASPYIYFVLEEVEKRGMPSEIAFLPMIESTFDPHDRSNKGAVGLWQLMPVLGRIHGLKQNSWYDGRKDIYESTKVALDHLQYLHKRFDGNWHLALAAYNSGEARVLSAIKKNRAAKKPTDYWSLNLPKETKDFVPKLLAWVEIIRSPKQYGLVLPNVPNRQVFTRVNTGKPIDIRHAAKMADISELQLRKLNPGMHKKTMDPNGPFNLVVPVHQAPVIAKKLNTTPAVIPTANTKVHQTKVAKEVLKAKTQERIVVASKAQPATTNIKLGSTDVVIKENTTKKKTAAKSTAKSAKAAGVKVHTVKKGDSIPKICKKYGIGIKTFLKNNGLKSQSSIIRPGQKLVIGR